MKTLGQREGLSMERFTGLYKELSEKAAKHTSLYHFTSLECLELIIMGGKMMLRRLDEMSDKSENDFLPQFWKKKVFACCFTHSTEGKPDFWAEYAKNNGVRIEFPNDLLNPENYHVVSENNYCFPKISKTTPSHKSYAHEEDWGIYDISKVDVKYLCSEERDIWNECSNGLIKNCVADSSYNWEEETRIRISMRPIGWEDTQQKENRFATPLFKRVFIEFDDIILRNICVSVPYDADAQFICQVHKILSMNPVTKNCVIKRLK